MRGNVEVGNQTELGSNLGYTAYSPVNLDKRLELIETQHLIPTLEIRTQLTFQDGCGD